MNGLVMGRIQRALDAGPTSVGYPVTREDVALLLAEAERLMAERDAVIGLLIEKSAVASPPGLWDALLPDQSSPLGFAWHQDFPDRAAAVAAVRAAAGLKEGE